MIFFARYEASQYGSPYIETEHLLLGLLREDRKLAMRLLSTEGAIESIRQKIEQQINIRERFSTSVEVPLSAECKRILNFAGEEADRLGHKYVGAEHLLLGMLRENKCFASLILNERGFNLGLLLEDLANSPSVTASSEAGELFCLSHLVNAWTTGNAAGFAKFFARDGQFVDPHGNLSIGPARIAERAHQAFKSPGWAKCDGKIEDVQFVGTKAVMATLAWEAVAETEKGEKPNSGRVRMTVILTRKSEGWSIARIQATGLEPQSSSATV